MYTFFNQLRAVFRRHRALAAMGACLIVGATYLFWPLSAEVTGKNAVRSTRILDRNGVLLREIRPEGRGIHVSLDEVHPAAIEALLAVEDRHFYRHPGVDPLALLRAMRDNVSAGRIVSGGSTITMQVARMIKQHTSRSVFHKIIEAAFALRLELHLTKDQILSLWLNRAYFGNQAYGIEAASRFYFAKPSGDLTVSEAAYLIGLPQSPSGYDPYRYPERASERHVRVLASMKAMQLLGEKELQAFRSVPLRLTPRHEAFKAPHFVEYLRQTMTSDVRGLPELRTTLDAHLQAEVEAFARSHLQRLDSRYITNAAAVVLDNDTGEILAYMGSVDFWNERTGGQNDGVRMLRQPGSALKPFTYGLALSTGEYTAASILPDIEVQIPEAGGAFSPQNYDKSYHGPVPLREALANSYNVPAVRLARELSPSRLLGTLHAFGFASLDQAPEHYGVGLTLGNGEVQLIELATAYATLARSGRPVEPKFIPDAGNRRKDTHPVIPHEIAFLLTDILSDPEARAAAFGRYGPLELPFPCAVKTGTSKDYRDNWAVGFTPQHTVAVWVGNFDGTPMQKVSGVSGAGPLFKSIMLHLGASGNFEMPDEIESHIICPASGTLPSLVCPGRRREYFLPGSVPSDTCAVHQTHVIDTRNELLAGNDTPSVFKQEVLFTVFPDIYRPWMRENNMNLPPASFSPLSTDSASAPEPVLPELQIAYPVSGMIFQIDPVLRRSYQRIELEGIVPERYTRPEWWIDEEKWTTGSATASWPLETGEHSIQLRALASDGTWKSSRPVSIQIVGVEN